MVFDVPHFDELFFRFGIMQERLQVRLDWYLSEAASGLQRQSSKLFNSENKEAIINSIKRLFQHLAEHIKSNAVLRSGLQRIEHTAVVLSRRILSPILKELSKNSLAAAGTGFAAGFLVSWILFGGRGRVAASCPMKPQHTTRAVICREPKDPKSYDGLEGLVVVNNVATVRISHPDQVLVRVRAASVDFADISILSGLGRHERPPAVDREDRIVLGKDLSGTVIEVGANVHNVDVGDSVWALLPVLTRKGALADVVVVHEDLVRRKPQRIGHEGAATVPSSGVAAWRALHSVGIEPNSTTKGKTVLVVDATSSVGCLAVQLVRTWGGSVVSVVNQRKLAPFALMLGSSRVIYIENDDESQFLLESQIEDTKFEAIVVTSNYGPGDLPASFYHKFLKNHKVGYVNASVPDRLDSDSYGFLRRIGLKLPVFNYLLSSQQFPHSSKIARENRVILDELKRLIDASLVQPVLDSTYEVSECEEAFQRTAAKSTIGKTVVTFK